MLLEDKLRNPSVVQRWRKNNQKNYALFPSEFILRKGNDKNSQTCKIFPKEINFQTL
jgi:hypothetical protein